MDESKRQAVRFLEKEIKTYIALALFLSKEGIKQRVQMGEKDVVIGPTYYKDRMKEARKLVNELRKPA
jgi:ABC-type Fe3+ transport system substrate-binding protein